MPGSPSTPDDLDQLVTVSGDLTDDAYDALAEILIRDAEQEADHRTKRKHVRSARHAASRDDRVL